MFRSVSRSTLSSSSSSPSSHSSNNQSARRSNHIQHVICLSTTHINDTLAWAVKGSQVEIDRVVQAGATFITHPLNNSKSIGNALPLYLNARHFSATFPHLQDHVRAILTPMQPDSALVRQAVMPTAAVRQAMVTEYFPQLARNMSVQLALSTSSATSIDDLERFVQVHLLWRATIQRIGQDAKDWIAAKVQDHAHSLSLGGSHARQVPLLELVTLLHVSNDSRRYSWSKLALRIVEENTVRLFQYMEYVRRCGHCAQVLVGDGADTAAAKAIKFANKLEALKVDGKRFVHWSVLRLHVQFLSALRRVPKLKSGAFNLHQAGGYYRRGNELLEPGMLANEVYERMASVDAMDSWDKVMVGMGAAPMEKQELSRWLGWCAEQGKCVHRSVHKCTTCGAVRSSGF